MEMPSVLAEMTFETSYKVSRTSKALTELSVGHDVSATGIMEVFCRGKPVCKISGSAKGSTYAAAKSALERAAEAYIEQIGNCLTNKYIVPGSVQLSGDDAKLSGTVAFISYNDRLMKPVIVPVSDVSSVEQAEAQAIEVLQLLGMFIRGNLR